MAEDAAYKNDHPATRRGGFAKSIDFVLKIVGFLIFSAMISILIEWIGMTFVYPEEGYSHAQSMMKKEFGYLGSSLEGDSINELAVRAASEKVRVITEFLFIDSGVIQMLEDIRTPRLNENRLVKLVKGIIAECYDYLMAAIYIIVMFFIRLAILILSIPAFLLFGLVGVSDGLMQRDLRRWCGGNESGYVYHWAKKFAPPVLILSWFIYLAVPNSVHPNVIISPFAALFGLVLMVMTSKFKKYL